MVKESIDKLYNDAQIKIEYYPGSEGYRVIIVNKPENDTFMFARGILRDLAHVNPGELEKKLDAFDPELLFALKEQKIDVNKFHIVLCQAYIEENRRVEGSGLL